MLPLGGDPAHGDQCTKVWDGEGATDEWHVAANWFDDTLPISTDHVCIDISSVTVIHSQGTDSVAGLTTDGSLTVSGGSLTVTSHTGTAVNGRLTISGGTFSIDDPIAPSSLDMNGGTLAGSGKVTTPTMSWTSGNQGGTGTTEVTGTATMSTASSKRVAGTRLLTLANGSKTTWTDGALLMDAGTRFQNAGSFDIQGDHTAFVNSAGTPGPQFENTGELIKSSGAGESVFTVQFTNDATGPGNAVGVQSGTLRFTNTEVTDDPSDGPFVIGTGATLSFTDSHAFSASSSITGTGTAVGRFGGGTWSPPAGFVYDVPNMEVLSGTATFAGTTRISGTVSILGGTTAFNGATVVGGISHTGGTVAFNDAVSPASVSQSGGTFGGTADVTAGDYDWSAGTLSGTGTTRVTGTLDISGPGTKTLEAGRRLALPAGAITTWSAGDLLMLATSGSPSVENAGLFDIQGDQDLLYDCFQCSNAAPFNNTGELRKSAGAGETVIAADVQNPGRLAVDTGMVDLTRSFANLSGSTLTGGTYDLAGTLQLGGNVATNAADLGLDGPGAQVLNASSTPALAALTTNAANGGLTLRNGSDLTVPSFVNAGAVNVGSATDTVGTSLDSTGAYTQTQAGAVTTLGHPAARLTGVSAGAGAAAVHLQAGRLGGVGTVGPSLSNSGELRPGGSPGVLSVDGTYLQTPAGTLRVEIGGLTAGSQHDKLAVSGAAQLRGALSIETIGGFLPQVGNSFEILSCSPCSGAFDTLAGSDAGGGNSYIPQYGVTGTALSVQDVSAPPATAPGTSQPGTQPPATLADLPAPTLAKTFNVQPKSGTVLVGIPAGAAEATRAGASQKGVTFVPLVEARQIPMGSFLDTTKGRVELVTATGLGAKTQAGTFGAGLFQVLQSRARRAKGLTELRLKGSSFSRCRSAGSRAGPAQLSRRTIRRLRASARGRFRTRGRHSAATVRGTRWISADRCDGTLTTVKRGKVVVRDFARRRNITLTAGKSYLARAGR